jgi:hypothetical protein
MLEEGIYKIVYDNDYPIDTPPGSDWEAVRRFMRDGPAIDKLNAEATVIFPFLQEAIEKDWNEKNLLVDVTSTSIGQQNAPYALNAVFGNLPLLAEDLPFPATDYYNGTRPQDVDKRVRADLHGYIVPCSLAGELIASNFSSSKSMRGKASLGFGGTSS